MITLDRATADDLDFIVSCEGAEETAQFIIPWTRACHLTAMSDPDGMYLVIRAQNSDLKLGFVLLFGLTSIHRSIELRRIVVSQKGLGIGRAAIRAVKELAFNQLNAHRLWLDVKLKNTRARHLYTSEGFSEEGIIRECLLEENGFESLVLMSILGSEIEAQRTVVSSLEDTAITVKLLGTEDELVFDRVAEDVFDDPINPQLVREFLNDPRHHIAVAIDSDQVLVGMASGVHYIHPDKPAQLFINEVGVSPIYQGRGIGSKLIETLLLHARQLKCTEAWVATEPSNKAARALYKRFGGQQNHDLFVMYTFPL